MFDRLLWVGTWLLSFLIAWLAIGYWGPSAAGPSSGEFDIVQLPWMLIIAGAAAGAVVLNLLLWAMDYFAAPAIDETGEDTIDSEDDSDVSKEP